MCGILAWFEHSNETRRFETALALQTHRGPDYQGTKVFPKVMLGHNRLSILDLESRSHQPFTDEKQRYWVSYNGEIYNYLELKEELINLGHHFRTSSDTEVLLTAFIEWGPEAFNRFNGMWAFILWDVEKEELWVSRDRFGIKPLYYANENKSWIFSSEIKPLLTLSDKSPTPNFDSIAYYLGRGLVDGLEDTWFNGIKRFPPAHFAKIKEGHLQLFRYWELPKTVDLHWADYEQQFKEHLENAIMISVRSDVPVGICLSGGIDSSAIAAVASRILSPLSSFSIRYDEPGWDEFQFVEKLGERLPLKTYSVYPDTDQNLKDLGHLLWHLEEPAKAPGVLSQWNVIALAQGKVKVLLDGQGGDEVFGGYDFHRMPFMKGLLRQGSLRNLISEMQASNLGLGLLWHQKVFRLKEQILNRLPLAGERRRGIWTKDFYPNWYAAKTSVYSKKIRNLKDRLKWDIEEEMLPALLRYEDKISMAYSIESRVPLLDYRLVEDAFRLPDEDLIHDGWSKYPLRKTISDWVPSEISWRKRKQGFATPIYRFLRPNKENVKKWLAQGQVASCGLVDPKRVSDFVEHTVKESVNFDLWQLVQTEWWLRNFIEGDYKTPMDWVSHD